MYKLIGYNARCSHMLREGERERNKILAYKIIN